MTIETDPQVVREIAREHIRSGRSDIGMSVIHHFGLDLPDEEFFAWERAVHKAMEDERRAVCWPDERQDNAALAETLVRLKAWLVGRQANIHSEISTTNVIAEPRDRSTAAWAIAESDMAAIVIALEARIAKAGT